MNLKATAVQLARRISKTAAANLIHYSGARSLLAAAQRRAVGGHRVLILSYHRVVDRLDSDDARTLPTLSITQATFKKHLELLLETHALVTMDEALEALQGKTQPKRDQAVVTFDDGYRGVYRYAYPVMKELGVPGIVYVPSGFVSTDKRLLHDRLWDALVRMQERRLNPTSLGIPPELAELLRRAQAGGAEHDVLDNLIGEHPTAKLLALVDALEERVGLKDVRVPDGHLNMTWEMLRELSDNGVEIGAHTVGHTVLTHEPLERATRELQQCKATLEAGLRTRVNHFAYCNGWYSPGLTQALARIGFKSAVTTEDLPNLPGVDPYALKRKVLWENSSAGALGGYSRALTACQFDDVFGALSLQTPVLGARPTFSGGAGQEASVAGASDRFQAHG